MFNSINKKLSLVILFAVIAAPVAAHNVKVFGDVAGTFHIEPGHNPKAGQRSQAWFALTRRGGAIIPLSQCNCQLAVYPKPHNSGSAPLMKPTLKAIYVEKYQGIPGAEIVFPRAGSYELELTGIAKNGANFRPFSLSYTVNIGS